VPSIVSLLHYYARFPNQTPIFNFYSESQLAKLEPNDIHQIKMGDCFTFFDQKLDLSFTFARLDHNYLLMLITRKTLTKQRQLALSKVITSLGSVYRTEAKPSG
jgi:hypothetical protein